jgi:signal transduction histidine kinase
LRVALELAEEAGDAAAVHAHLAGIAQDVGELERLVADVLAASRLDAAGEGQRLARAPVAPSSLVAAAAERFRRGHATRELHVLLSEKAPEILADRDLLGRVLDNLLENAVRYSDPGTPIELSVRDDGKALVVSVADRGIGVPIEDLPRLFEPFFRTERSRSREAGGIGLGLTLCKRIVEVHGGSIAAAPNPGGGLVVTFRLSAS